MHGKSRWWTEFVYVVEEDKSKENRNLWCIKTCEIKDVQNDCYPVLEGIKVGDQAISNILKLRGALIQPES